MGCRVDTKGTMGIGALGKALQRFKTCAKFWRMGKSLPDRKSKSWSQAWGNHHARHRSVRDSKFLGNPIKQSHTI